MLKGSHSHAHSERVNSFGFEWPRRCAPFVACSGGSSQALELLTQKDEVAASDNLLLTSVGGARSEPLLAR